MLPRAAAGERPPFARGMSIVWCSVLVMAEHRADPRPAMEGEALAAARRSTPVPPVPPPQPAERVGLLAVAWGGPAAQMAVGAAHGERRPRRVRRSSRFSWQGSSVRDAGGRGSMVHAARIPRIQAARRGMPRILQPRWLVRDRWPECPHLGGEIGQIAKSIGASPARLANAGDAERNPPD